MRSKCCEEAEQTLGYEDMEVGWLCALLASKVLRLARVNKGSHSFTCHSHTYPHME